MILAVDTGNTQTEIGLVDENLEVVRSFRIPTDRGDTDFGYATKLHDLFEICEIDGRLIDGAVISSVVPNVTFALERAIKLVTGKDALVVGRNVDTGLVINVEGGALAPDLETAAVAAKEKYPLPCIIVDMGTATTVTVVDEKGEYIGGVILPGTVTALNALVDKTSLLPSVELVAPKKALANETVAAIQSGVVYGAAGSIDGIIDHFVEEMAVPPASMVATGGLGKIICPNCRHKMIINDDLMMEGLGLIWKNHNKN